MSIFDLSKLDVCGPMCNPALAFGDARRNFECSASFLGCHFRPFGYNGIVTEQEKGTPMRVSKLMLAAAAASIAMTATAASAETVTRSAKALPAVSKAPVTNVRTASKLKKTSGAGEAIVYGAAALAFGAGLYVLIDDNESEPDTAN
ncbi:hypothetical protein ACPVPU_11065 [Sphingomonas sp. CJ99]